MNAVVRSKAFRSGDGIAMMLPDMPGLFDGAELEVVITGPEIVIRPVAPPLSPVETKRRMATLYAELRAIGPISPDPARDADERIEFPDRPGL